MHETKHSEIWHSEEVAWEMKGKMNPTEVVSVGRGGGGGAGVQAMS